MVKTVDDIKTPEGPATFTMEVSQQGYRMNKLCYSLKLEHNRELFKADYMKYIKDYNLSEVEIELINNRDWLKMAHYGVSAYLIGKMVDCFDTSFIKMGAIMRGETQEDFMGKTAPLIRNHNPDEGNN